MNAQSPLEDPGAGSIKLSLTPGGHLRLSEAAEAGESIEPRAAERIRAAFERGQAHGLFHLGAREVGAPLPPVLAFWRELGKLFMTGLCSLADLKERRAEFSLPAPREELALWIDRAPPMEGGEYLSGEVLEACWEDLERACREELGAFDGDVDDFLQRLSPAWNAVGRVHFHLAEQKGRSDAPFAFLATYTSRLGEGGKVKHLPLGQALKEFSAGSRSTGGGKKQSLLAVLRPLHRAAEGSPFLKDLVDSGAVFHPLAWSPREAYCFLKDLPTFESSGIIVKVPDWWRTRSTKRPLVQVTVGARKPSALGLDALLDFSTKVVLEGEELGRDELRGILAVSAGLTLIRGRWVEVDAEKLRQVLDHWSKVEEAAEQGLSFAEGLRLLAGAEIGGDGSEADAGQVEEWSSRVAGPWLDEAIRELRQPGRGAPAAAGTVLKAVLRPYQETGVRWLRMLKRLGLGGCLADDMGLGKTVQVLALLSALKSESAAAAACLLVAPASLIANWMAEIERFAPALRTLVAHSSAAPIAQLRALDQEALGRYDVVITSYGMLGRLPWCGAIEWDLVVLDEAQAIKNPGARQTRLAKALRSRSRFALTGTPIENRLGDLWSIFDFINPGLLGSAPAFTRMTKRLEARAENPYEPLRTLIRPYILRRLKTDRTVIADLPDKTEVTAYCSLTKVQAALYEDSVESLARELEGLDGMRRRGVVLAYLNRFKQILNHPSQWLGDGVWDPAASGKFARLREICESIALRQEKVLVFTQYREMTEALERHLTSSFGRGGLVLHGGTPVAARRRLVERFQDEDAEPFFVISLRAGGTGLNLTAASHVIHFDRWWNPAVESQATDRAFRIGQKKNVLVHKFVCKGTVEEKVDALLSEKRRLSAEILEGGGEAVITEMGDEELLRLVRLDFRSAMDEGC
jgi:non-specific serine/threonine protein kinase